MKSFNRKRRHIGIRIFIPIIYYPINGYPDSKLSVLSIPIYYSEQTDCSVRLFLLARQIERREVVYVCMYVCMYVFILQQDNTQNIKPEGQQGSEALTAARNKKCLEEILATTHNMTETKHNKNPSLMNPGLERTT